MTPASWNHELVARIASEIKRTRTATSSRLSAAKLSDRTDELGMRITRAVISDLENGRKKTLDISELIVLARALDVPPLQLIYPNLPDGATEAWPGMTTTAISAAQWFSGELVPVEADDGEIYFWNNDPELTQIGLARSTEKAYAEYRSAVGEVKRSAEGTTSTAIETAKLLEDRARENLIRIAGRAIRAGSSVNLNRFPVDLRTAIQDWLNEDPNARARRIADEMRQNVVEADEDAAR